MVDSMRSRDSFERRPSSSAETSIDENTADQLLADDFSIPTNPITSRAGAMTFVRPTSSDFNYLRRTPSMASSQASPSVLPPPRTTMPSQQTSTARNNEPDLRPPSAALITRHSRGFFVRPESQGHSVVSSHGDPFIDPTERGGVSSVGEKHSSELPLSTEEAPTKRKYSRKFTLSLVLALILLLILIPIGVLVIKSSKNGTGSHFSEADSNGGLTSPRTHDPSLLGIPSSAVGTVLDSTKWLDWTDFNVTYTNEMVGGLSLMVRFYKYQLSYYRD